MMGLFARFQRVLLAIDGSDLSLQAADVALALAGLFSAKLDLLSVAEIAPRYVSTREESDQEQEEVWAFYQRLHDPIRQRAERKGIAVQSVVCRGHEVQTMLAYAQEHQCDLLLAGAQGHSGGWGMFLGSTVEKLANHTPCSLFVLREKMRKKRYQHILVALDGSPLGWQAFQVGMHLALAFGATLHAVSVVEGPHVPPASPRDVSLFAPPSGTLHWNWAAYLGQIQAQAIAQAALAGVHLDTSLQEGHASSVLVTTAREQRCDLLLLGATGQEHPWSVTTGGTARKVVSEAPCSVLLIRPPAMQQRVQDLMSSEVVSVPSTALLREVMIHLIEQGVKLLPVVNEQQHVLGVMTLGSLLSQDEIYRHLDLQRAGSTEDFLQHLHQFFAAEKVASEVMIRHPMVVKADVGIEPAVRWMLTHHLTRMPVVDAEGKLVGMLDQEQLLRAYTDRVGPAEGGEGGAAFPISGNVQARETPHTIGEMMLIQVPLVAFDTPPSEVLRHIQSTPFRRVIVVRQDGSALGVIADRDLLAAQGLMTRSNPLLAFAGRFSLRFPEERVRRSFSSGLLTAQQVMKPHLYAATPAMLLGDAIRLMLAHHIKRLVVIDNANKPLGLVDRQQLLQALIERGSSPG